MFQGRTAEGLELARQTMAEADRLGHTGAVWQAGNQLMVGRALTGDIAAYEQACLDHIELSERSGIAFAFVSRMFLASAQFLRGRWEEAREQLEALVEAELTSALLVGVVSGFLIRAFAYLGDRDKAIALLQERSDALPRRGQPVGSGNSALLAGAIEALAVLGEFEQAAALHDGALACIETGMRMSPDGAILVETSAAIAAACGEQWDVAEQHFETALRQAHEIPTPVQQAEVRRWHAWMLLSRDGPGDRDRARELLAEAIAMYREIGMPKHLEIAETMLAQAGS